jgi:hypothetical protein
MYEPFPSQVMLPSTLPSTYLHAAEGHTKDDVGFSPKTTDSSSICQK